ncbi:hypothetical protein B0H14DRAFT_1343595 [Mycena olivaceomarginata]|nr:hypothetical protein B0H14DRAFT_1343595 [Mycena olivaceomarginata]
MKDIGTLRGMKQSPEAQEFSVEMSTSPIRVMHTIDGTMRVSGEPTADLAHNVMFALSPSCFRDAHLPHHHQLICPTRAFPAILGVSLRPVVVFSDNTQREVHWWRPRGTSPSWIHSPALLRTRNALETCSKGSRDCDDFASLIRSNCMLSLCYGRSKIFLNCLLRIKSTGVTPKDRSYT